jgi:hypothetical protein
VINLEDIEVSLGGWQKRSQQGCSEDGEFHDAEFLKNDEWSNAGRIVPTTSSKAGHGIYV